MTKLVAAAASVALFCTFFAGQALAEKAVMTHPIQAGSLHEGPLDMISYWVPMDDGGFEVTATFISREADAEPKRVMMALRDGDGTTFAMPGYMHALYSFERKQDQVEASVKILPVEIAEIEEPDLSPARVVASAK